MDECHKAVLEVIGLPNPYGEPFRPVFGVGAIRHKHMNFYDRNLAGALVEPMRKEFGLWSTDIGLMGSVFIWIYAIIGVPLGMVADRGAGRS